MLPLLLEAKLRMVIATAAAAVARKRRRKMKKTKKKVNSKFNYKTPPEKETNDGIGLVALYRLPRVGVNVKRGINEGPSVNRGGLGCFSSGVSSSRGFLLVDELNQRSAAIFTSFVPV